MMFTPTSRYQGLPLLEYRPRTRSGCSRGTAGDPVPYVSRRFLPAVDTLSDVGMYVVGADDRLDRIAAARFGDPEAFWRVVDANPVLDPDELTQRQGRLLRIALPAALVGSPRGF